MILEHLSSKDGVDFVKSAAPQVGGTITPYHMILTRTDWFGWGLKPYMYVHAGDQNREGPRRAAQGRDLRRGLLLPRHRFRAAPGREEACGQRHPRHLQRAGRDRDLRESRSRRKARSTSSKRLPRSTDREHYKLPPNEERITLEKVSWTAPEEIKVAGPDERALVYRGGETIEWKVVG